MDKTSVRPLTGPALLAATLLQRWCGLPRVDASAIREDLSEILDMAL